MAVFELLTTTLGVAIAKSTLKIWLKDHEIAKDVGLGIVDIVKGRVESYRAQKAAERTFSRIADQAASMLEPLITSEFRDLSENSINAIVLECSTAISSFIITPELLASKEIDPAKFAMLISSSRNLNFYSDSERELFSRLIAEGCELIIDLAECLPGFTARTLGEVLEREAIIIKKIDETLDDFRRVRETVSALDPRPARARFEDAYRRQVARALDEIELFGASEVLSPRAKKHTLTLAYIALTAVPKQATKAKDPLMPPAAPSASSTAAAHNQVANIEALLSSEPRLVVRGEAGSGKTTLLQYVAVKAASVSFEGDLGTLNAMTPFFVRLRQFAEGPLPAPEDFPKLVAPFAAGMMPQGWVHELLKSGNAVLLIDGVDELASHRRRDVEEWIRQLVAEFPDCRFVVTSRPTAVRDAWLSAEAFAEAELLPMQPSEVDAFIDHWHFAAAQEVSAEDKSQLRDDAQRLKLHIREDRALRELATSPLLCALICAMNRERHHVLPSNRISLYETALSMLLHRRDVERKVKINDAPNIDLEEKQALLQELAIWLMENQLASVQTDRAIQKVGTLLPSFPRINKRVTAEAALQVLIQRSGVLRSPVEGHVDFVHKTFQEFLCAKAIVHADRMLYLLERSTQERWRDVAILAVGLANEIRRDEFMQKLIEAGDNAPQHRRSVFYLLAVACLETAVRLSPTLQAAIIERISRLHPPQNMGEAKALSRAGDLALGLLGKFPGQKAVCAAACVRTLRLIGSERALSLLEEYGIDLRATVSTEVIAAWPFFPQEDYARRVLSRGNGVRGSIFLDSSRQISGLRHLQKLTSLHLARSKNSPISDDLYEISHLSNLKRLTLYAPQQLDSLSFTESMKNLLVLDVRSKVTDVSSVSGHTSLTSLRLRMASDKGLESVFGLETLRNLSLSLPPEIRFTPKLASVSSLTNLSLAGESLETVGGLQILTRLQHLRLLGSNSLSLEGIQSLQQLRHLVIRVPNGMRSLSWARSQKKLLALDLNGSAEIDLHDLEECAQLQTLIISDADSISSFAPLSKLPQLKRIHLVDAEHLPAADSLRSLTNVENIFVPRKIFEQISELNSAIRMLRAAPIYGYSY